MDSQSDRLGSSVLAGDLWLSDMLILELVEPALPIVGMSFMWPTQAGSPPTAEHSLHSHLKLNTWHDALHCAPNSCPGPCRFVRDHVVKPAQANEASMQRFRELSEQAVAAGGLHIAKGGQLWDIYRYDLQRQT